LFEGGELFTNEDPRGEGFFSILEGMGDVGDGGIDGSEYAKDVV
jgi:hypothetical protein